ncbi:MAG: GAF domain-containing protein [Bacteroidales bacterium]|nr:GAF domain-containing protein [Bacteroidales bacterium]
MKSRIKSIILLYFITTLVIIYSISIGYTIIKYQQISEQNTLISLNTKTNIISQITKNEIDNYFDVARTISQVFLNYQNIEQLQRRPHFMSILKTTLIANPELLSIWSIWEPYALDTLDSYYENSDASTIIGNFSPTYYRSDEEIFLEINSLSSETALFTSDYYTIPKNTSSETILNPYYYSYTGKNKDKILQTSLIIPLIHKSVFLGVVGVDIPLKKLQNSITQQNPNSYSDLFLISNQLSIVSSNQDTIIGNNLNSIIADTINNIGYHISKGYSDQFLQKNDSLNTTYYYTFSPICLGKTNTPWSLLLRTDEKEMFKSAKKTILFLLTLSILSVIVLAFLLNILANKIIRPIKIINKTLTQIAQGKLNQTQHISISSKDEIGKMATSVNILFDNLNKTSDFAKEIGSGKLEAKFNLLSKDDVLGKSLLDMQISLNNARLEEVKRTETDDIQKWISDGITRFGEILRNHTNIKEISDVLIRQLIDYVEVAQGSLFMINDNDTSDVFYEPLAAVAFGREKLIEKTFKKGESVIGRAIQEKRTISLNDAPNNFVNITSGLLNDNPNNILIVPLKIGEEVFGIIELVSFDVLANYKIEFIEKVGENIASTLYNLKINQQTLILLEQSQQQAEELASQEEEMRQNMEEMQTTQEETAKREFHIKSMISAINKIVFITEYNPEGKLIYINEQLLNLTGISQGQLMNKSINNINYYKIKNFDINDWETIKNGQEFTRIAAIKSNEKSTLLKETFSPVYDEVGSLEKIVNIAIDISEDSFIV